jgi:HSP20 family molecular chaperone IbpA
MSELQMEKPTANGAAKAAPRWRVTPDIDVYENEVEYLVQLDVPGASAESINVQVLGTELRIRSEQAPVERDTDATLVAFERQINLPGEVDADSASAQLKNGVLEIRVSKSASARRVKIPVSIN